MNAEMVEALREKVREAEFEVRLMREFMAVRTVEIPMLEEAYRRGQRNPEALSPYRGMRSRSELEVFEANRDRLAERLKGG